MFKDVRAFGSYSVNDVSKAKQFYGDILGIDVTETMGMLSLQLAGGANILVYPKPNHAPATFTVLNFPVRDIAATVAALKSRGVQFERYDEPGLKTDPDGICRSSDGPTIAWFKDPAGNIVSVLEENK